MKGDDGKGNTDHINDDDGDDDDDDDEELRWTGMRYGPAYGRDR